MAVTTLGRRRFISVQEKSQEMFRQCRSKMRMSGLCKVEMSGFIQGGRRDGSGANRVERERTGSVEGVAASRRRSFKTNRSGPAAALERPPGPAFAKSPASPTRFRGWAPELQSFGTILSGEHTGVQWRSVFRVKNEIQAEAKGGLSCLGRSFFPGFWRQRPYWV
jgi:hypothetical protein